MRTFKRNEKARPAKPLEQEKNQELKMKHRFVILVVTITILIATVGCKKSETIVVGSNGLDLLWNHSFAYFERERGYQFSFYGVERIETLFELLFEYQIDNNKKSIEITLVDKIDKGKCECFGVGFACMDWDGLCTPSGSLFIPEKMLDDGIYTFIIRALGYTIQSEFIITKEKAILNIPENDYFSSDIKEVFITPKNLLYGGITVDREQNKEIADNFLDDVRNLGQQDTIWTNPHIFLTMVDEAGKPITNYSPPDAGWHLPRYQISFLMTQTSDFSTIFELAENYIMKISADGYPYWSIASTNGDNATLSHTHKYVWYANKHD